MEVVDPMPTARARAAITATVFPLFHDRSQYFFAACNKEVGKRIAIQVDWSYKECTAVKVF